jgi:hypothetical protein
MIWKPTDDMDREIRGWMKLKGWQVTRTNYDEDRQVYAWRHDAREAPSQTLRISREVLEGYPPFAVVEHLGRLRVAERMRTQSHRRWVVVQRGSAVELMRTDGESYTCRSCLT